MDEGWGGVGGGGREREREREEREIRDRSFFICFSNDGAFHKVLDERMPVEQVLEMIPGRFFRQGRPQRRGSGGGGGGRCRHLHFVGEEGAEVLFGAGGHQYFRWDHPVSVDNG